MASGSDISQNARNLGVMLRLSFAAQGCAPGEAFALRWENIYLNGTGGLVQVTEGKTKASRRMLPMVPAVYAALKARREAAGNPEEGWVFPASSWEGHLNKDTAKDQHKRALARVNANAKKSGVKELNFFQPDVLRHAALTRLAEAGCDVFTLARIAGHFSITITQRYVTPKHTRWSGPSSKRQRPHSRLGLRLSRRSPKDRWAQKWAHRKKGRFRIGPNLLVRKGGLEPPRFYPPDPKSGASANSATFATL
jgi:integrase